jgi:hypothetical protein
MTPVAMPDGVAVLLDALDEPFAAQRFLDGVAGGVAGQAGEAAAVLVDHGRFGEDVDGREVGAGGDVEVVRVVGGGDLDGPCPELGIDGGVGDHRDLAAHQRKDQGTPDGIGVALVVGMHRHTGVAQHRLGAGRGHGHGAVAVGERVADVDEFPVDVLVFHFDVGQGGVAPGTPVDDPVRPVDEPLVVEPDEHDPDSPGAAVVHRETLTAPVTRRAHLPHLLGDAAALLRLPLPHPLDERLAADLVAIEALFGELPFDDVLRGDPGVVGAGEPEGGVPLHALAADRGVDQRVLEGVAHVQRAGHVGRRNHDAERLAALVDLGPEGSRLFPERVPASLDGLGVVGLRHLGDGRVHHCRRSVRGRARCTREAGCRRRSDGCQISRVTSGLS